MALPQLTPEQRAEALAKATAARKARSELLASIKSGERSVTQLLNRAGEDTIIARTRVKQLLKAVPGFGDARVATLMEDTHIAEDRRVAGLGERQLEALRAALP